MVIHSNLYEYLDEYKCIQTNTRGWSILEITEKVHCNPGSSFARVVIFVEFP